MRSKNRCTRMDPCGTPFVTSFRDDQLISMGTYCCLFVKNDWIVERSFPPMTKFLSYCNRILWGNGVESFGKIEIK